MNIESEILYSRPDYDIARIDPHWADVQMVQMIGRDKKVLEIGCASGHFGKYLKTHANCKVWGVELDERLAKLAAPYYEKIFVGEAQGREVQSAIGGLKFDVILCSNVLEHTPKPLPILMSLKPLLAGPSGFFVIALPNVAHFTIRLRLLFGNFDPDQGILGEEHLRYFTFKTARKLIEDAGLKVDQWSFDSDKGIPKFDGLLRRIPKLGPWFLDKFYWVFPKLFSFQYIFKCSVKA